MRLVIDTNVLVSALLNPHGAPARVLDLVLAGSIQVLWDDRLMAEYADVLARPKFAFGSPDVRALLDYLRLCGNQVQAGPLRNLRVTAVADAFDLPFAEVAVAGHADALVTGNPHHFRFLPADGPQVLSPDALLAMWSEAADYTDRE